MKKFPIPRLPIQGLLIRCLTASGVTLAAGCPLPELAASPAVAAKSRTVQTAFSGTLESPAKAGQSFNISNSY